MRRVRRRGAHGQVLSQEPEGYQYSGDSQRLQDVEELDGKTTRQVEREPPHVCRHPSLFLCHKIGNGGGLVLVNGLRKSLSPGTPRNSRGHRANPGIICWQVIVTNSAILRVSQSSELFPRGFTPVMPLISKELACASTSKFANRCSINRYRDLRYRRRPQNISYSSIAQVARLLSRAVLIFLFSCDAI